MNTLDDLVRNLRAYVGNDTSDQKTAAVLRAAHAGIRALPTKHDWAYYLTLGRVTTSAPYSTGTVAYDHTGGSSERLLTLTGGTWPTWAAYGTVIIDNAHYDVDKRLTATTLTLKETSNPGGDVAGGTSFQIYRSIYPLPADLATVDNPFIHSLSRELYRQDFREFIHQRNLNQGVGEPREYCVVGAPGQYGRSALAVWPPPDAELQLEFLYKRKPRAAAIEAEKDGTVSVTAASTTVTGAGTAFTDGMVGSVFRLGADKKPPTGPDGTNPAVHEAVVTAVASAQSLTLDVAPEATYAAVGYVVSDPIDVADGPMYDALVALCRKHLRIDTRMNVTNEEVAEYKEAIAQAKAAEAVKEKARVVAGQGGSLPRPYPTRTDFGV